MTSTLVVLARHGESVWNVEERYQGQADSGLTARGRAQADQLAAWLVDAVGLADKVLASDSARARDTAGPYLERTGQTLDLDPRLRELDAGTWTGHTFVEMAAVYPDLVQAVARGEDVRRGGGETFAELGVRVRAALADAVSAVADHAAEDHRATVCVFTHGGPIRVATAAAVGAGPTGHPRLAPPTNCSVTVLQIPSSPRSDGCGLLVQYNAQITPADRPSRAQ